MKIQCVVTDEVPSFTDDLCVQGDPVKGLENSKKLTVYIISSQSSLFNFCALNIINVLGG